VIGCRIQVVAKLTSLFLITLILNCAEVAPPPGGEEDKSSPTIIRSAPANGSLNVAPGREITFWFSEGVIRPATTKPVFIFPRQSNYPEIKWHTDRLSVKLAEPFDSNQTYVLTLTSEISDWRRNKMDSTFTISFSTGERIDSGSISGYVLAQGRPKTGALVGLYEANSLSGDILYDSVFPNYITQSSSDGSFKFRFLPRKQFRLVAFDDINRNERLNPEEESFGLPDRVVDLNSAADLSEIYLELSQPAIRDTAIVSAILTPDGLVKVRFNTSIDLSYLKSNLNTVTLESNTESMRTLTTKSFLEANLDTSSILTLYAGKIDSGSYTISVRIDSSHPPIQYQNLNIPETKDKNQPALLLYYPEDKSHFLEQINIKAVFSEPIDTAKLTTGTFMLTNELNQPIALESQWRNDFQVEIEPSGLEEGRSYSMSVAEFEISDLAGNLLGDSIRTYKFSTLNTDSLGSASGIVSSDMANKKQVVREMSFRNIAGPLSYNFRFESDTFNVKLPAGKYLASGYLDQNNNGKRDLGMLRPYKLAESFARFGDTITVRARFETAGIEFKFK
jgi:hypothetical protein